MENFKTGEIVAINVRALFSHFGVRLRNTEIAAVPKYNKGEQYPSDYWYDLNFQTSGELACMDGEECEIANIDKYGNMTFRNNNGDEEVCFTLSADEAKVALFS